MFKKNNILLFILFLLLVTNVSGCKIAGLTYMLPQSHFKFPNSNIIPLGNVKGEASASSTSINIMDADLEEEAIQNALKQKGGDLLINYTINYEITGFLFSYTTTVKVEGLACKMEIGEQILR